MTIDLIPPTAGIKSSTGATPNSSQPRVTQTRANMAHRPAKRCATQARLDKRTGVFEQEIEDYLLELDADLQTLTGTSLELNSHGREMMGKLNAKADKCFAFLERDLYRRFVNLFSGVHLRPDQLSKLSSLVRPPKPEPEPKTRGQCGQCGRCPSR